MRGIAAYFGALGLIVLLDLIVLGGFLSSYYSTLLSNFWRESYDLQHILLAFVIYALLALGQFLFVRPHVVSIKTALVYGAAFGLCVYGVHEFTNYVLIQNWPIQIVIIDILWGIVLNAIVALGFVHKVYKK